MPVAGASTASRPAISGRAAIFGSTRSYARDVSENLSAARQSPGPPRLHRAASGGPAGPSCGGLVRRARYVAGGARPAGRLCGYGAARGVCARGTHAAPAGAPPATAPCRARRLRCGARAGGLRRARAPRRGDPGGVYLGGIPSVVSCGLQPYSAARAVAVAPGRGRPGVSVRDAVGVGGGLPSPAGAQWVAEQARRGRWVLAVAGTHGKTTTAGALAWILEHAGL